MKILITVITFTLTCLYGLGQTRNKSALSTTAKKVADINAYVNEVNKNLKPFPSDIFDDHEFQHYSIYTQKAYTICDRSPYNTVKIVKITRKINTTFYKDNHLVYMNEISAAHGDYSNIRDVYFQTDKIIYATKKVHKEEILQIQQSYDGAKQGGSYNLIITKDSIIYSGDRGKIAVKNSLSSWNRLKDSFSLYDFDKIQTDGFRSHIDGHDLSYIVTTDKRTHSFVNAIYSDKQLKTMAKFFEQICLLTP
jgi:hypothetical protein